MSAIRSFAGGFAGGYLLTSAVLDPRKTARRVVAAVMFLGSVIALFLCWMAAVQGAPAMAAVWALILIFTGMVSISKFATRIPFSVFRYGRYVSASIMTSRAAQVWWVILALSWIGTNIAVAAESGGVIAIFIFLTVFAIIGVGVTSVRVENKVVETAIIVRNEVARALGAHPETIDSGNTGTLRKPEYTCVFPMILHAEQAPGVQANIERLLPDFEIVGLEDVGVSVVKK